MKRRLLALTALGHTRGGDDNVATHTIYKYLGRYP